MATARPGGDAAREQDAEAAVADSLGVIAGALGYRATFAAAAVVSAAALVLLLVARRQLTTLSVIPPR